MTNTDTLINHSTVLGHYTKGDYKKIERKKRDRFTVTDSEYSQNNPIYGTMEGISFMKCNKFTAYVLITNYSSKT